MRTAVAVSADVKGQRDPDAVSSLIRDGVVALVAPSTDTDLLRRTILRSLASPVDVGFLHLYPRIAAVGRSPETVSAHLELGDALQ